MLKIHRPAAAASFAAIAALGLAASTVAQEAATAGPDTVVATVAGEPVTLAEMQAVYGDLPAQYLQAPDDVLYDFIRRQLVDQRLLAAAAEAEGVADEPDTAMELRLQREGLLAQTFVNRAVAEKMTDEALRAAYEERIAAAPAVEEVRASHILVDSREKAEALRAEIDGGADFAALAAEHGTDGTSANGGDLGWFTREMMVAPFADAAFAMETGSVSEPVQTQFGWHLIQLVDRRDQPKPPFEEVREALEQELGGQMAQEVVAAARDGASVELPEARPGLDALRPASE